METAEKNTFLPTGVGSILKRRAIEMGGVLLIAFALTLFAALATYNPSDPSFNTAAEGSPSNLLAQYGAIISDLLLQSMGLSTVLGIIIVFAWGWQFITTHSLRACWVRLALLPVSLLLCALTLTALGAVWTTIVWPIEAGLGGFVGQLTFSASVDLIAGFGFWPDPRWITVVASLITLSLTTYLLSFTWDQWRVGFGRAIWVVTLLWRITRRRRGAHPALGRMKTAATQGLSGIKKRVEPTVKFSNSEVDLGEKLAAKHHGLVEPKISKTEPSKRSIEARQRSLDLGSDDREYELPPLDLLDELLTDNSRDLEVNEEGLQQNARLLEQVLEDFGIQGEIIKVRPGPVVTL